MIFLTKFDQKGCFQSKTKKSEHHYWILHTRISLSTKFQLELTIFICWTKFAQKEYFRSKTDLHILVSVGIKFQLKLTILIFWAKFPHKGYFSWEMEKSHLCVRPWSLLSICTGAERRNGILMSLLLLVAKTTNKWSHKITYSESFTFKAFLVF